MSVPEVELLDPDALPRGTSLCSGRFVIESTIGRGGVATVYRVRTEDGRVVALKLMIAERAEDPDQRERFINEWEILDGLRDLPFVVTVEEHGFLELPDGRPYYTMELLESPTFDELTLTARLVAEDRVLRACRIIRQVADALAQLHARGIVHRDIKPSNIVVEGPDRIRLLDFGYAYSSGEGSIPATPGLTTTEQRPGTYLYMATERAIGMHPEPSFDVYALSITLYEALAGRAPNHDLPVAEMARIKCEMKEPELSIAGRVFGIPRTLEQLVDHGLRRVATERIASAVELRDRLDEVLAELGGVPAPETRGGSEPSTAANETHVTAVPAGSEARASVPVSESEPTPERRRGWIWLAPLVLVAAVAMGLVMLKPDDDSDGRAVQEERDEAVPASRDESVAPRPRSAGVEAEPPREHQPVTPREEGSDVEAEPAPAPASEAAEPDRMTKPERTPSRKPKRRLQPSKPAPEPGPRPDDEECIASRERALAANTRGDWATVLQETRQRACWGSNSKRLSLRLSALYESGKYEQCAALANKVSDPTSRSIARLCQRKLEAKP